MKKNRGEPGIWLKLKDITADGLEINLSENSSIFDLDGYNYSLIDDVQIRGVINRFENSYYLDLKVNLDLNMECSRCLSSFKKRLFFRFDDRFFNETETVDSSKISDLEDWEVPIFDGEYLNIYQPVHDQISFAIPVKPLCSDGCRGLCSSCGGDLNFKECFCDKEKIDPRFEILREIKGRENGGSKEKNNKI